MMARYPGFAGLQLSITLRYSQVLCNSQRQRTKSLMLQMAELNMSNWTSSSSIYRTVRSPILAFQRMFNAPANSSTSAYNSGSKVTRSGICGRHRTIHADQRCETFLYKHLHVLSNAGRRG